MRRVVPLFLGVLAVVSFIIAVRSADPNTRQWTLLLALLLFVLGLVFMFAKRLARPLVAPICGYFGYSPATITIFPNRKAFRQSLAEELGDAGEVWCAWYSGSVALAQGELFGKPRKVRLVLTNPQCAALGELARISNLPAHELASDIQELTKQVVSLGGEVKWFDGLIQNSTTIADPKTEAAWARVEFLIPYKKPVDRPSIRMSKSSEPDVFSTIKESFEALWDKSQPPT